MIFRIHVIRILEYVIGNYIYIYIVFLCHKNHENRIENFGFFKPNIILHRLQPDWKKKKKKKKKKKRKEKKRKEKKKKEKYDISIYCQLLVDETQNEILPLWKQSSCFKEASLEWVKRTFQSIKAYL